MCKVACLMCKVACLLCKVVADVESLIRLYWIILPCCCFVKMVKMGALKGHCFVDHIVQMESLFI